MVLEAPLLNSLKFTPTDHWLAQALLVSPKVATLTGDFWPKFGQRLSDQDLWEPASLTDLGPRNLESTLSEAIQVYETRRDKTNMLSKKMQGAGRSWILGGKLSYEVSELLLQSGYASRSLADGVLEGDASFIDSFLYLGGRNLADKKKWHLDVSSAVEANVALTPLSSSESQPQSSDGPDAGESALLGLRDCMPTLAPGVTLDQVIDFREREKDSFNAFRAGLDQLVASAPAETSDTEPLKAYHQVLRDFSKAAHSFGVRLRMETRYLVLPATIWASVWGRNGKFVPRVMAATGAALSVYNLSGDLDSVLNHSPSGMAVAGFGLTLAVVATRQNCPFVYLSKAAKQGLIRA